jgi:NAD(P)-dependent dehydrogenase (short-subunit alcohol dehydrogenase family)
MLDASPRRLAPVAPATLLRADLLQGARVVVAGAPAPHAAIADAVAAGAAQLGATVARLELPVDEAAAETAAASLSAGEAPATLVCDAAGALAAERTAAGGAASPAADAVALTAAVAGVWNAVRATAAPERAATRVVLVAPGPDGSPVADAARAALENLARTLSVEWARHGITAVSIAPGADTAPSEIAALAAYLASPAGAYYSGTELDLRGPIA